MAGAYRKRAIVAFDNQFDAASTGADDIHGLRMHEWCSHGRPYRERKPQQYPPTQQVACKVAKAVEGHYKSKACGAKGWRESVTSSLAVIIAAIKKYGA